MRHRLVQLAYMAKGLLEMVLGGGNGHPHRGR